MTRLTDFRSGIGKIGLQVFDAHIKQIGFRGEVLKEYIDSLAQRPYPFIFEGINEETGCYVSTLDYVCPSAADIIFNRLDAL
jgi:hypothetical protein